MAQEGCARVGCVCDLSVTEMPSLLRTLAAVGRVLFRRESASHREACARTTVPEWCVGSDLSMAKWNTLLRTLSWPSEGLISSTVTGPRQVRWAVTAFLRAKDMCVRPCLTPTNLTRCDKPIQNHLRCIACFSIAESLIQLPRTSRYTVFRAYLISVILRRTLIKVARGSASTVVVDSVSKKMVCSSAIPRRTTTCAGGARAGDLSVMQMRYSSSDPRGRRKGRFD